MAIALIIVVITGNSLSNEFNDYIMGHRTIILLYLLIGIAIQTLYSYGKWKSTKIAIFK